jgi:hypothetical protein
MHTGAKKPGVVEHERAPHSKSGSRSHHVEVVLARIFARQRGYSKQKSLRSLDVENAGADWH